MTSSCDALVLPPRGLRASLPASAVGLWMLPLLGNGLFAPTVSLSRWQLGMRVGECCACCSKGRGYPARSSNR